MTILTGTDNLICNQGATLDVTWVASIDGTAINWTGYTAKAQVREYQSTNSDLIWSGTTANGGVILNAYGMVKLFATATTTNTFPVGVFRYDVELTAADGTVTRFMQGKFDVSPQVSA